VVNSLSFLQGFFNPRDHVESIIWIIREFCLKCFYHTDRIKRCSLAAFGEQILVDG
jgi:hypothetical protein